MCIILTIIFSALAINFYNDGDITNAVINGLIAAFFILLILRNIRKTIKEKKV